MSRLGYAIGEIANGIFAGFGIFLDDNATRDDKLYAYTGYVNSGDALTELRNIRKMLLRASYPWEESQTEWKNSPEISGLDQGGIIEELDALAMLFRSGRVQISINPDEPLG